MLQHDEVQAAGDPCITTDTSTVTDFLDFTFTVQSTDCISSQKEKMLHIMTVKCDQCPHTSNTIRLSGHRYTCTHGLGRYQSKDVSCISLHLSATSAIWKRQTVSLWQKQQ